MWQCRTSTKKLKMVFGVIAFFLLVGAVVAYMPKNFRDIEVSVDIRQVKGDSLEVWWGIENKGNIKTTANVVYGYSKYDYEKETWTPILEEEFKEMLDSGIGIGTGGIAIDFEPGYYMFWIKQIEYDKVKENNEAKVFYTIN